MQFRTRALHGVVLVSFGIIGCAASRHPGDDPQLWSWKQQTSSASRQTPYRQYGLSVSPYPIGQAGKPAQVADEFNFSHPRVDNFLTRFQTNMRGFFSSGLSRSGRYVPRMSSILQKEGVPQQLAYLPLIESGYRQHAVSRAGAVGPWQLIPGTGRRYGLRIDRYVDERRDPVKSTQAAARYLKDLHAMFGDWHLSLAAYNTGEQHINRILERGHADDFWEMSDRGYLCEETENFVPEFLAALQIAESPEAYGFEAPDSEPVRYDLVNVDRPLPLSKVAQLSGSSPSTIKELNPALHRGVVPPQGYAVRLPKGCKEAFEVAYANLPRSFTAPKTHRVAKRRGVAKNRQHHVRRGETVASIAKQHKVSVKALLKANGLRNPRNLQAGRNLRVPATATRDEGSVVVARRKGHSRILD